MTMTSQSRRVIAAIASAPARPVQRRTLDRDHAHRVGHGVGEVDPTQLAPIGSLEAGLLAKLALHALQGSLPRSHAAFRDLPGVTAERVAMLPDQHDPVVIVEGDHARGKILEMNDAVDAGVAVGSGAIVVPDRDPRVL